MGGARNRPLFAMTQHFTESDKDAPWNGFFGLEIVVMAEQTSRRASPRTMDAMCFRSRFHDWQTHTTHPCSCFLFEVCIEMERQLRIGAHALKHSCFSVRGVWWCDPRRGGNCKFEVLCNYIQFTPTRGGVTRIPCSCREASICVRRCGPRRQPGHALALPR